MKNKKIIIVIVVLLFILLLGIIINNTYCFNNGHKGVYPVNSFCTKCHGRDGIVQHECANPNGMDKYCRRCGKIVLGK